METLELYQQQLTNLFWSNDLSPEEYQIERLVNYANLLVQKNEEVNLISRKDEEKVIENHIFHCAFSNQYIPEKVTRFLDIGTGGGLPGIPFGIMRPLMRGVLVDSIGKKVAAVDEFIKKLKLGTITAVNARVESPEFIEKYKDSFDLIITRATVPLTVVLRYSLPLIKNKAYAVALKGGNLEDEILVAETKWKAHIKKLTIFELAYKPSNLRNAKDKKLVLIELIK